MARKIISVRLSPEGLRLLDNLAKAEGLDRSELIRTILAEGINKRLQKGATQ